MTPHPPPTGLLFFDPSAERVETAGRLPHWSQAGVVTFVTFRTWDSLPRAVLDRFFADRDGWLRANGIDPSQPGWEGRLRRSGATIAGNYNRFCSDRWEADLDRCHGACPLRDPACAAVVAAALRHFDGDRYRLTDFVVMPNHVHMLAAFPDAASLQTQCKSWKRFTAVALNRQLARSGRFWQEESFDHLVRSAEQFEYHRDYIADNPRRANLHAGEFYHHSADLPYSLRRVAVTGPLAERADYTPEANP
ncbi:MAG: transposase [Gemmataceae bacterium]